MASIVSIPFNFQPASTQKGTGTYTCPAGKYALVTVTTSGSAYPSSTSAANADGVASVVANDFNISTSYWVSAGDTISATLVNASGTQTTGMTFVGTALFGAQTTSTINHNGSPVGIYRARCTFSLYDAGGAASYDVTFSGSSSFYFFAQEFNQIT